MERATAPAPAGATTPPTLEHDMTRKQRRQLRAVVSELTPEIVQAHRVHLAASALNALLLQVVDKQYPTINDVASDAAAYADAVLHALGIES